MHHEHLTFDGVSVRTPLSHRVLVEVNYLDGCGGFATAGITGNGDLEVSSTWGDFEGTGVFAPQFLLGVGFAEFELESEYRLTLRLSGAVEAKTVVFGIDLENHSLEVKAAA